MSDGIINESAFEMNYNFYGIDKGELNIKLNKVLENTIKDLPFGSTISSEYKQALRKVIYYIMYYNKENSIATIPMITGGGKSTALINATAYMVNDSILFPYCGTVILKLEQKDCDEAVAKINKKAGREVAYSYHSGIGKNKRPKNQISKKKLKDYPILIMCHEGFKELMKCDKRDKILDWSNAQVNKMYSEFNKLERRRLVIDEEISNVEIKTITLKTITMVENEILNMGNKYLFNIFNKFITEVKKEFIKPYDIKRNSSEFIHINIEIPDKLSEYIYKETSRSTQEAYLALVDLIKHGGYIQYSDDINKKCITTYAYINVNVPIFYKIQLDATANINYLYNINKDYSLVSLPNFKTYYNTHIHVFDKITGSRSTIEKGFNEGLLDSCIKDITSKANNGDKVLIILNNKTYVESFQEKLLSSELYHGCKDLNIQVDFTYYGAFTGKNNWSDYNKLFSIGIPIYSETTYPILYHVNNDTVDLTQFDTTLVPMNGARRYLQQEFEKVRVSLIAKELIQGINRIRCRWFKDGDTPEAHIYMINKDKEVDYLIKKAMPEVNMLYDWDLDYRHNYSDKQTALTSEEALIQEITKIQDNPIYKELLIAKGLINDKGIKKSSLRELCNIKSRQTFSDILNTPIFHQFCKDRNIDLSNTKSHYLQIQNSKCPVSS